MAVPYTFGSATTSIPLSQLDSNFATAITLGNTAVQLGNTITTLTGVTNLASSGSLTLGSNGNTTAVTIDTSQNVGIGTSSPNTKLQASAGSSGSGVVNTLRLQNVGTSAGDGARILFTAGTSTDGAGIASTGVSLNAADLRFYSGSSVEAMRIDTSGNVGIGTTSPSTLLQITTASTAADIIKITNSTQTLNFGLNNAGGGSYIFEASAAALRFGTNNTERMRIDSSGRLLIGTTTSGSYFDGPLCAYNASALVASFKTDSATAYPLACYNTATSGNNLFITFLTEGTPTTRGYIDYNRAGTAVRYNTSSDERLKKNIVDSGSAIPLINSIKIRSYDWKETDSHVDFGVIAQELNTVAPDAVSEGTTGDDMTKTWGVDTSTLVPALVKAIQEQQALIQSLTTRITALEAK